MNEPTFLSDDEYFRLYHEPCSFEEWQGFPDDECTVGPQHTLRQRLILYTDLSEGGWGTDAACREACGLEIGYPKGGRPQMYIAVIDPSKNISILPVKETTMVTKKAATDSARSKPSITSDQSGQTRGLNLGWAPATDPIFSNNFVVGSRTPGPLRDDLLPKKYRST